MSAIIKELSMALMTKFKTKHGIELQDAYINIISMQASKQIIELENDPPFNQFTLRIYADVYASQKSYADGLPSIEILEKVYPMDTSKALYSQAYDQITAELGGTPC